MSQTSKLPYAHEQIETAAEKLKKTMMERITASYPSQVLEHKEAIGGKVRCYMIPEHSLAGVIFYCFIEGAAKGQEKVVEVVNAMTAKPGRT